MTKNKIIKTAMVSSEPYEVDADDPEELAFGGCGTTMKVYGFSSGPFGTTAAIKEYDGVQSQCIEILGDICIKNNNGSSYFWARTTWGKPTKPFYVITHDQAVYMSTSKRLIKKAIKKECGCKVK